MKFEKGDIVDVKGVDGVTTFRGEVVSADEHHFTVHGSGWSQTYTQDTTDVEIFSNG